MFIINWIRRWRYYRMMKKIAHEDYEYMEFYKKSFTRKKKVKETVCPDVKRSNCVTESCNQT